MRARKASAVDYHYMQLEKDKKAKAKAEAKNNNTGWISVKDSLPSNTDPVLIFPRPEDDCFSAEFWDDNLWHYYYCEDWDLCEVTHWMPIPADPISPS